MALHVDGASLQLSSALPGHAPPFLHCCFLTCCKNCCLVAWEGKLYFGWALGGEEMPPTRVLDSLCGAGSLVRQSRSTETGSAAGLA